MVKSISEEDLFAAALAFPTAERDRYLRRVCGENSPLLARLMSLLCSTVQAEGFVREQPHELMRDGPRDYINRYLLLEELGEGGCGVCYRAEQLEPVKRDVALKVIKPGMDTKAVISRFKCEQQALALMDHPNIASVFDAGETRMQRPYVVMELVRGIRITDYCNQSRLSVPERLALFGQVCHGIQHAHHRGVIHRDIKPSNVLVTLHDGTPLAKVIDFGLAKALRSPLVDRSVHTSVEQFLGTPAYASPEQAEPEQREVDTRSDIYSLGVLLYELLTGSTPFESTGTAHSRSNILRRIQDEEPSPPSRRLSDLEQEGSSVAVALYGTTISKLSKQIRGDLDWIVLKCLAKDRGQRYQSANDLWLDIGRYLKSEGITARPPSLGYSIRKCARRHRVLFTAGLVLIAFVLYTIGFSLTISVQAKHIATERDRTELERRHAQQIANVALDMLAAADLFENDGREISGRELLDLGGPEIKGELDENSVARVPLLEHVGRAYRRRGEMQKAILYLDDAVHTASAIGSGGDVATISAMIELSITLCMAGDFAGSREMLAEASRLVEKHGLQRTALNAKLLLNRGRRETVAGELRQARADLEMSLQLSKELLGPRSRPVANVLVALALLDQWTDDLSDAEANAREANEIFKSTTPPMSPDRVTAEVRLAEVLHLRNQSDQAETIFLESLQKQSRLFGRNSWQVADVLESLARVSRSQGRLDEAESYAREAISTQVSALGEENPATAYMRMSLAVILTQRGKYAEAEVELRRSLESSGPKRPSDQYIASGEYLMGEVFLATGRLKEAEVILASSMDRWRRSEAPAWRAARSASALGEALYRQGRAGEAQRYLVESHREINQSRGAEPEAKLRAQERLSRFVLVAGLAAGAPNDEH